MLSVRSGNCSQCGWCCETLPIEVTHSDVLRWSRTHQTNILRELSYIDNYPEKGVGGFYIVKTALNPKQSCPFLTTDITCGIHTTKPQVCKFFPSGKKQYPQCYLSQTMTHNVKTITKKRENLIKGYKNSQRKKEMLLQLIITGRGT